MTRVAVLGAAGRMGVTVTRTVAATPDLTLVAAIDPAASGRRVDEVAGIESDLTISGEVAAAAEAEVAIDFTVATAAARANLAWCGENGVHVVAGTTGFSAADLDAFAVMFGRDGGPNCVIAPNFAISAVLLMRLCEIAAPFFDSAEIIELHHDGKRDAPSGTAIETARRIAAARDAAEVGAFGTDPTEVTALEGVRGGSGPAGLRIHSVRLRGLVAHQEVLFGSTGQSLTIRQDSTDRDSFMPGVLLATRRVAGTPGLTVGLDAILFPA